MVRNAGALFKTDTIGKGIALELVIIRVLVLAFSVVVHEFAHGWAALRLGDPTAQEQGRLTLNPLPHIDPVGSILVPGVMALLGGIPYGWAKPVPVSVGRLNDPHNDHPKVAAAGPLSNLILAFFFALALGLTVGLGGAAVTFKGEPNFGRFLFTLFQFGVIINVVLALFNLFPLPPMDGSWILSRFLPPAARVRYENMRRYGMLFFVGLMVLWRYTDFGSLMSSLIYAAAGPYFQLAQNVALAFG